MNKRISAQPFDFTFDPATTALIVIDMQRDFVEPNGFLITHVVQPCLYCMRIQPSSRGCSHG
ncbi:hypothetical protein ACV1C2_25060, partial [Aeromonas hydrophila]